jgi:hypothetical protein
MIQATGNRSALLTEGFSIGVRFRCMNILKFLRTVQIASVALIVLPLTRCPAQDKPAGEAVPSQQEPADPHSFTMDFPGGPLSKLLADVAAQNGLTKFSIIRESEDMDPVLPAFSVRNQPPEAVIVALGRIVVREGYNLDSVGPNLAVLSRIPGGLEFGGFAAFQLAGRLESQSVDEITSAVQAACEFAFPDQKISTLRFRYHPGTKLLFVAGSQREIGVAHEVIGSIVEPRARNNPLPPPAEQK